MLGEGPLPLQWMLEIWGFLMYVVHTYPWFNPNMKGMHLTVDSWQPGQAEDSFKMTTKEIQAVESSLWGRASLPCTREDEGEGPRKKINNKQLNKLPLILLCTIRIDDSLFDCRVLPQQGRDGVTGSGIGVPDPFEISLERPKSF